MGTQQKHYEKDPLSLISLFVKKNAAPPPAQEQMVPERDRSHSKKSKTQEASETRKKPAQQKIKPLTKQAAKPSKTTKKKALQVDDEIEEEIEQPSGEPSEEPITESIPSFAGPSTSQPLTRENVSSSIIEESIQESIPAGSRDNVAVKKQQSSGTVEESIQEESALIKSASGSQSKNQEDEEISEESYLQDNFDQASESGGVKAAKAAKPVKPVVQTFSKKADRIKKNIEEDYENDGFESYHGSLQADKLRAMQVQQEQRKQADTLLRPSASAIKAFEENKEVDQAQNKKLLGDLREELERYERAVSGSIFIEQFQHTVTKSLAQKDTLLIAQRLAQLEQENKHKEEIASIREEQIRMMSQLMLLNASAGGAGASAKQTSHIQKQ